MTAIPLFLPFPAKRALNSAFISASLLSLYETRKVEIELVVRPQLQHVSSEMDSDSMVEPEMAAYSSSSPSVDTARSPSPSVVESTDSSLVTSNDESNVGLAVADPSVVVGMACRVPGATNTSQLWKVLAEKKDLQKKMPEDRFNVDAYYHPQGTNKGTVCTATSF